MGADISVGIAVQGEREFNKALTACQNTLKQLDSSLKANAAGFEDSAAGMSNSAQRARLLNAALDENRKMEAALGDAIEFASKEYGEASRETTKYVVAQNKAREAIARIEQELKGADREMEEFGRDSQKVARQIDNGITDSAEKAGRSIDEMVRSIKEDVGSISMSTTISAISDAGNAIMGTFSSVNSFAESSRDRRRELAMLEANSMMAQQEYDEVYAISMGVAALTGDMNASIEGTSALLRTGFDTSEISLAIETLGGAVIAFPETMKFENLAESLQESMAAGEATGAFAELMERCGMSTDEFKNAMSAAQTEEEKQQVALSTLNAMGLRPTYEAYTSINEGLINAQGSTDKLSDAMTRLGGTVDTWLTPIKNTTADAINGLVDLWEGEMTILEAADKVGKYIGTKYNQEEIDAMAESSKELRAEAEKLESQIHLAYLKGDNRRAIELMGQKNVILGQITDAEIEALGNVRGNAEPYVEMLTPEEEEFKREWTEKISNWLQPAADAVKKIFGKETSEAITESANEAEVTQNADAIWETFETESRKGGKNAAEAGVTEFNNGIKSGGLLIQEEMLISGTNGGNAFAQGIGIGCENAISIAQQTVNSINAIFAQIQAPVVPAIGSAYYAGTGGNYGSGMGSYNISMNIDGKTFGRVTSGYTSMAQAQFVSRLSRLNA